MPGTYIVAVAQMAVKPMDPEGNFAKASAYIRSAANQGARLVVLPEWHLTHFVNGRKQEQFMALADQWPQYLAKYCDLARECRINIVPGTMLQRQLDNNGKSKYLNTAFFIDETGHVLGSYSKKNLWGTVEKEFTIPGQGPNRVMDTPIGRVGLLVCYDIAMPHASSELLAQGVEWIIIPGQMRGFDGYPDLQKISANSNALMVDAMTVAHAYMANSAVIWANGGGDPKRGYTMSSQIALPIVGIITKTPGPEEQIRLAHVDLDILKAAEGMYEYRADFEKRLRPDSEYPYVAPALVNGSGEHGERGTHNQPSWEQALKARL